MDERELRRIYIADGDDRDTADLRDGEVVEAIRLGGPRDGDVDGPLPRHARR